MCLPKELSSWRAKPSPGVTYRAGLETVNLKRCVFLRSCLFERFVWAKPSPGVTYRAGLETVNLKRCVFLRSCLFERFVWAKPSQVNLKSFVFLRSCLFERSVRAKPSPKLVLKQLGVYFKRLGNQTPEIRFCAYGWPLGTLLVLP